jgi:hypothetical protein
VRPGQVAAGQGPVRATAQMDAAWCIITLNTRLMEQRMMMRLLLLMPGPTDHRAAQITLTPGMRVQVRRVCLYLCGTMSHTPDLQS